MSFLLIIALLVHALRTDDTTFMWIAIAGIVFGAGQLVLAALSGWAENR